jgi:hypothetical protein
MYQKTYKMFISASWFVGHYKWHMEVRVGSSFEIEQFLSSEEITWEISRNWTSVEFKSREIQTFQRVTVDKFNLIGDEVSASMPESK